jgi:hypothetical protein
MDRRPAATEEPALQARTLISMFLHSILTFATSFFSINVYTVIMVSSKILSEQIKLILGFANANKESITLPAGKDSLQWIKGLNK